MTLAYRYEETENTKRLVRFHEAEEDARPHMLIWGPPPPARLCALVPLSHRERRWKARRGAGRGRRTARPVALLGLPMFSAMTRETIALDRHVYRDPRTDATVLLYLLAGTKPTDADEHALIVAAGYRAPACEERERTAMEERAEREFAQALATIEAERAFRPSLPAWW